MARILAVALVLCSESVLAGEPSQVTSLEQSVGSLALSPDGKLVAFEVGRPEALGDDICVMSLADGKVVKLTATRAAVYTEEESTIGFTPDGKGIVFVDQQELWLAPVDGKALEQLTKDEQIGRNFFWPGKDGLFFAARRGMDRSQLKGKIPKGVAGFVISKLYRFDLATRKVTMFTNDVVSDTGDVRPMADGRLVAMAAYDDGTGRYSDGVLTVLDSKGKRTRTKLSFPFLFEPGFLQKGQVMAVVDQVWDEKSGEFTYPIVTWDFKSGKKGNLETGLPSGAQIAHIWPEKGGESFLLSAGTEQAGYDVYRHNGKETSRLTNRSFTRCEGGAISPDGKKLFFIGTLKNQKSANIWELEL